VLCCPALSATHQSHAVTFDVEDGGHRVSPITTGLREHVLTGLCAYLVKRLQSVRNTAARKYFSSDDLTMSLNL